ncbi:hypothetical protein J2X63_002683 [Agromyces sp. 3263]|uniref:hypothetical protein n=1 Tax=Agromyces sp. 3263 TaxID=2817750 RepID=UPI0028550BA0|nr:hypothetical protein [Agromyces sp. 3263]MDR6906975.1 hypothetical protein [Agromyces sp. 3263]
MARSPSTEPAEPAGFDVREYARSAHGSLRDDLDLEAIASASHDRDVVAVLGDLRALEGATMAHLRNVLVTPTHKDARVTAFLVTWAFEKFWIADALAAVIEACGGSAGVAGGPDSTLPPGIRRGPGPVRRAVAGFTQGSGVVGAHLTVGLVDDWIGEALYARVLARDPSLAVAIARVAAIRERHTRFFEAESGRRLPASRKAARLARRELRITPWPLGAAALAPGRRRALARFAWPGPEGRAALGTLERRIAGIPGIGTAAASVVSRRLEPDTPNRRDH